jgi:hypothetical protein
LEEKTTSSLSLQPPPLPPQQQTLPQKRKLSSVITMPDRIEQQNEESSSKGNNNIIDEDRQVLSDTTTDDDELLLLPMRRTKKVCMHDAATQTEFNTTTTTIATQTDFDTITTSSITKPKLEKISIVAEKKDHHVNVIIDNSTLSSSSSSDHDCVQILSEKPKSSLPPSESSTISKTIPNIKSALLTPAPTIKTPIPTPITSRTTLSPIPLSSSASTNNGVAMMATNHNNNNNNHIRYANSRAPIVHQQTMPWQQKEIPMSQHKHAFSTSPTTSNPNHLTTQGNTGTGGKVQMASPYVPLKPKIPAEISNDELEKKAFERALPIVKSKCPTLFYHTAKTKPSSFISNAKTLTSLQRSYCTNMPRQYELPTTLFASRIPWISHSVHIEIRVLRIQMRRSMTCDELVIFEAEFYGPTIMINDDTNQPHGIWRSLSEEQVVCFNMGKIQSIHGRPAFVCRKHKCIQWRDKNGHFANINPDGFAEVFTSSRSEIECALTDLLDGEMEMQPQPSIKYMDLNLHSLVSLVYKSALEREKFIQSCIIPEVIPIAYLHKYKQIYQQHIVKNVPPTTACILASSEIIQIQKRHRQMWTQKELWLSSASSCNSTSSSTSSSNPNPITTTKPDHKNETKQKSTDDDGLLLEDDIDLAISSSSSDDDLDRFRPHDNNDNGSTGTRVSGKMSIFHSTSPTTIETTTTTTTASQLLSSTTTVITAQRSQTHYNIHGFIHRSDSDMPAILGTHAIKYYLLDHPHRENNMPAIILTEGCLFYFVRGVLHTDDKHIPAVVYPGSTVIFYKNNQIHRDDDLPALIDSNFCAWFQNGVCHRDFDRPAHIQLDDNNSDADHMNINNQSVSTNSKNDCCFNPANVDANDFIIPQQQQQTKTSTNNSNALIDRFRVGKELTKKGMMIAYGYCLHSQIIAKKQDGSVSNSSTTTSSTSITTSPAIITNTTQQQHAATTDPRIYQYAKPEFTFQHFYDLTVYVYYEQLQYERLVQKTKVDPLSSSSLLPSTSTTQVSFPHQQPQYKSYYVVPNTIPNYVLHLKHERSKNIHALPRTNDLRQYVQQVLLEYQNINFTSAQSASAHSPVITIDTRQFGKVEMPRFKIGSITWYTHGLINRENDKPASIRSNGSRVWYKHGLCHRDNDLPSCIFNDGRMEWRVHGQLHCRSNDKPALSWPDGTVCFFKDGKLHRDGGDTKPTVIPSGHRSPYVSHVYWYVNGVEKKQTTLRMFREICKSHHTEHEIITADLRHWINDPLFPASAKVKTSSEESIKKVHEDLKEYFYKSYHKSTQRIMDITQSNLMSTMTVSSSSTQANAKPTSETIDEITNHVQSYFVNVRMSILAIRQWNICVGLYDRLLQTNQESERYLQQCMQASVGLLLSSSQKSPASDSSSSSSNHVLSQI